MPAERQALAPAVHPVVQAKGDRPGGRDGEANAVTVRDLVDSISWFQELELAVVQHGRSPASPGTGRKRAENTIILTKIINKKNNYLKLLSFLGRQSRHAAGAEEAPCGAGTSIH
jgi:hypothetical protein